MPGAGKSTVGVVLAKLAGLRFVDTDLDIQVRAGASLQQILERDGYQRLRALEEDVLLALDLQGAVVATGGSAVYSEAAMGRLKQAGPVVYLEVDLATLQRRVAAAPLRGIACDVRPGVSGYPCRALPPVPALRRPHRGCRQRQRGHRGADHTARAGSAAQIRARTRPDTSAHCSRRRRCRQNRPARARQALARVLL